jgi:two-component system LytT family sensor kinase
MIHKPMFKLTFWHYQIVGFILFTINEFARNFQFWFNSINSVYYFIYTLAVLFLLTIIIRYIYRYLYDLKKPPFLYIIVGSFTSLLFAFFWQEIRLVIRQYLLISDKTWLTTERDYTYLVSVLMSSWTIFVWSMLYFGIKYWKDLQEESERLKVSFLLATKAKLQMLRYQINPHFLFNSLNSIKALTFENPEQAGIMLTELSEFLRATLSYNENIFVPVKAEIEIIEKYLAIEKIRFEERLKYKISFDNEIIDKEILCFISQPLVENAIKHGLTNNSDGITLLVNFKKSDRNLLVEVINTGTFGENMNSEGTGIKNVTERLDNAYPGLYNFSINVQGNSVVVRLLIPDRS